MEPKEALERLREAVMGIDVHPVAVRLARTAWVMAARPLLEAAAEAGYEGNVAIPLKGAITSGRITRAIWCVRWR